MNSLRIPIVALLGMSGIRGQVYSYEGDSFRSLSSVTVMVLDGSAGTIAMDGEYNFELAPGDYTIVARMQGFIEIVRNVRIIQGKVTVVSFKMVPANLWNEIITTEATQLYGYLVANTGSPISDAIVEIPNFGLSDTTSKIGHFYVGPFNRRSLFTIQFPDGSIDSTRCLHPSHCPTVISVDTEFLGKNENRDSVIFKDK